MVKKNKSNNPNLRTKAWGPPAWFYITCVAMGYPDKNPTKKQRREYKKFYVSVGKTLPCCLCRESYEKFLKQLPLTSKVLSSRKNLVHWLFKIHNKVNKKLKCKVLKKKQLDKKYKWYENFRAVSCSPKLGGCIKAVNKVKEPKRTKVIMFVDEEALKLRAKDKKKKKSTAKKKKKSTAKKT